jgi:hypothetical protein
MAGAFVSRDPIGFYGSQWSLFRYVNNRPTVSADPFGLFDHNHHHFPQWSDFQEAFSSKCLGDFKDALWALDSITDFIHQFTSTLPPYAHSYIHNDLDYNERALEAVSGSPDCCSALKAMLALINEVMQKVSNKYWPGPNNFLPIPEMQPYHHPQLNTGSTSELLGVIISQICNEPPPQPCPASSPATAPDSGVTPHYFLLPSVLGVPRGYRPPAWIAPGWRIGPSVLRIFPFVLPFPEIYEREPDGAWTI